LPRVQEIFVADKRVTLRGPPAYKHLAPSTLPTSSSAHDTTCDHQVNSSILHQRYSITKSTHLPLSTCSPSSCLHSLRLPPPSSLTASVSTSPLLRATPTNVPKPPVLPPRPRPRPCSSARRLCLCSQLSPLLRVSLCRRLFLPPQVPQFPLLLLPRRARLFIPLPRLHRAQLLLPHRLPPS
jgi:hypothetical protein